MTVGVGPGYVETVGFVPDPLAHGSISTDGLKGNADSDVRTLNSLWNSVQVNQSIRGDATTVAAAGALAAQILGIDVAIEAENTGSPTAYVANTDNVESIITDPTFGAEVATVAGEAAIDETTSSSSTDL